MNRCSRLAGSAVLAALLLPSLAVRGSAETGHPQPGQGSETGLLPAQTDAREQEAGALAAAAEPAGQFQGLDGLLYASAPLVVDGPGNDQFFGPDFDVACGVGAFLATPMRQVTKLARVIERSGRRVVWTVAPSKTVVHSSVLDPATIPHGECTEAGLHKQSRLLDHYRDPTYLPLRRALTGNPRQMFWRTDPHWTTVGGSVFAKTLAKRLDPRLGRRQHYSYGSETQLGLFNSWLGIDAPETLQTAMPAGPVTTRTAKDSVWDWAGYPQVVTDHSWVTTPASRTWRGRTLLIGDSFMFYALPTMRQLFHRGRFTWLGTMDESVIVDAIKDADTVVMEAYQTFLPLTAGLGSKEFRQKVRRALR